MVNFPHSKAPAYTPQGGESPQNVAATKTSTQNTEIKHRLVSESPEGVRTTTSASLRTSYSYSETYYSPAQVPTTDVYELPNVQNTPQESAGDGVEGSNATLAVDSPSTRSAGAATVVAFIEQRIATDKADGATAEALQSRLEAGLEGFLQGYNEAAEQLKEMGLYAGAVQVAVEQMFNQVISAFSELADKYGLENPAAEVQAFDVAEALPVASVPLVSGDVTMTATDYVAEMVDTLSAANQESERLQTLLQPTTDFYANVAKDKESSESRLYTFELRTNDGDVISVHSYADRGAREQVGQGDGGSVRQVSNAGMQDFNVSVQGDLDVDEMRAISDLLAQLNDVASTFFNGDIYDAYSKALDIGFDSDEIARFSLSLTQSEYSRVENTYGSVAKSDMTQPATGIEGRTGQNRMGRLGNFMHQLEQLQQRAKPLGFERQLPDLGQFIAKPIYGSHPHFDHFGPLVGRMMSSINRT